MGIVALKYPLPRTEKKLRGEIPDLLTFAVYIFLAFCKYWLISSNIRCTFPTIDYVRGDIILMDFKNAPFYILCLFHMIDLRMFSLSCLSSCKMRMFSLSCLSSCKMAMIRHDFDLLMLFILAYYPRKCFSTIVD